MILCLCRHNNHLILLPSLIVPSSQQRCATTWYSQQYSYALNISELLRYYCGKGSYGVFGWAVRWCGPALIWLHCSSDAIFQASIYLSFFTTSSTQNSHICIPTFLIMEISNIVPELNIKDMACDLKETHDLVSDFLCKFIKIAIKWLKYNLTFDDWW